MSENEGEGSKCGGEVHKITDQYGEPHYQCDNCLDKGWADHGLKRPHD